MKILAHRGDWTDPAEKNARVALSRAFANGFGIETDLRDHDGGIVISHDPPVGSDLMSFDDLLAMYVAAGRPGALALNIKADGLQRGVAEALTRHACDDYFVFDMAVPDAVGYLKADLRAYTRISEYEPVPSFADQAAGIWMDAFLSDWIDAAAIEAQLARGYTVALVSPELHGRPHLDAWRAWKPVDSAAGGTLLLCTDFPNEAQEFFTAG